jgi:hypothetical protein
MERDDGVIEAGHCVSCQFQVQHSVRDSMQRGGSSKETLDRCRTSWAEGKLRKGCVHCLCPHPPRAVHDV